MFILWGSVLPLAVKNLPTELGRASGFDGNLERTQSESTQVQKMVKTPESCPFILLDGRGRKRHLNHEPSQNWIVMLLAVIFWASGDKTN